MVAIHQRNGNGLTCSFTLVLNFTDEKDFSPGHTIARLST